MFSRQGRSTSLMKKGLRRAVIADTHVESRRSTSLMKKGFTLGLPALICPISGRTTPPIKNDFAGTIEDYSGLGGDPRFAAPATLRPRLAT
jgi:hypothetical protein